MFPFMAPAIIKPAVAVAKPQDMFASSPYTAVNGSKTIINGVDLAGKGGLIWEKRRSASGSHYLADTVRGVGPRLSTETTNAEANYAGLPTFNNNGYVGYDFWPAGELISSWSFAFSPKFCVAVTWTGDGTSSRQIPHGLGVVPGMVIVKRRDAAANWIVTHRSLSQPLYDYLLLNDPIQSRPGSSSLFGSGIDASKIVVGNSTALNDPGGTYVAYLFAHDPSADGIVQCGSFTPDADGTATLMFGWRPQFMMYKRTTAAGSWGIVDTSRGWGSGNDSIVFANSSNAEISAETGAPTSTGATIAGFTQDTCVYLAIRAPY